MPRSGRQRRPRTRSEKPQGAPSARAFAAPDAAGAVAPPGGPAGARRNAPAPERLPAAVDPKTPRLPPLGWQAPLAKEPASPQRAAARQSPAPALPAPPAPITQRVKDEGKRAETDVRMDELVAETSEILKFLQQRGEEWATVYALKGKEKAEEQAKDWMSGKDTDYVAKIRRKVLKTYWDSLSTEEKLQMVGEAADLALAGARQVLEALPALSSGGSGRREKTSDKPKRDQPSRSGGLGLPSPPSASWLNQLTLEDMQTLYKAYQKKREVSAKIEEIQAKVVEEAGKLGESVGKTVGSMRDEADFVKRCNERKQEFMVARKRYQLLKSAIEANEDESRYSDELEALRQALAQPLNAPAMVYHVDLNEEGRFKFREWCAIARDNLAPARFKRKAVGMVERGVTLVTTLGGLLGPSQQEQQERLDRARNELVVVVTGVVRKDWSSLAKGLFVSTPAGVKKVTTKITAKGLSDEDKLQQAQLAAAEAAAKESKNRAPVTQIFYDALAGLKLDDPASLARSKSILQELEGELG